MTLTLTSCDLQSEEEEKWTAEPKRGGFVADRGHRGDNSEGTVRLGQGGAGGYAGARLG